MKTLYESWQFWALLSAIFAALTAIFAKIGVEQVHPDYATFIRTLIVVCVLALILAATGNYSAPGEIPTEGMSKRIKPGDEAGARTIATNPMGRVGRMEELENLATFLISGGCDWINGETIAMDGAQGLAMGGNFYQLRDWSDDDWNKARESIKAQNEKDRASRG